MEEFYDLVEHAIDCAFEKEMYLFKCYIILSISRQLVNK